MAAATHVTGEVPAMKLLPVKPEIDPADLSKVDIRVGLIERVSDVPKSEKLIKLAVDFGDHKRTVLVGMKGEREDPREIEGKQALFVVNLSPREMMGEISEAMLLDIGYENGITPVLAVPETPLPNGASAG